MNRPDKIRKNKFMAQNPSLKPHIPVTLRATRHNFNHLLNHYKDVIFKPIHGSGGIGVYRIKSLGNSQYLIHHEAKRIKILSRKAVFQRLHLGKRSSYYLVQPRIPLMRIDGRIVDLRIIVQRKSGSRHWEVTGKIAKKAGRGYIVSNITRTRGLVQHVQTALNSSALSSSVKQSLVPKINLLALKTARYLYKLYPGQRIFGIDMGIDRSGKLWIIEVNRRPALSHFRKLGNRIGDYTMYNRIRAYHNKKALVSSLASESFVIHQVPEKLSVHQVPENPVDNQVPENLADN